MNKHQKYDLAQMQSLPLDSKIAMSKRRIVDWYEYWDGNVYVSRSGGKDSDVVGHLVKELYPDVPQIFINTGLEYDSVRNHALSSCDAVLHPELSFFQVITKYGYPVISKEVANTVSGAKKGNTRFEKLNGTMINKNTGRLSHYNCSQYRYLLDAPFRISDKCCQFMKKEPALTYEAATGRKPILGLMASESRKRKDAWFKTGCNAFQKKNPQSQPIAFWTEQDVLLYIKRYHVQISEAYGEIAYIGKDGLLYDNPFNDNMALSTTGESRTGCLFCLFGIADDTDRFLRLKRSEPEKYDYIMRGGHFDAAGYWVPYQGLGYHFVIDWLNEHGNMRIKY